MDTMQLKTHVQYSNIFGMWISWKDFFSKLLHRLQNLELEITGIPYNWKSNSYKYMHYEKIQIVEK